MTRKEMMDQLQAIGMTPAGEKQLKQLLQLVVAGRKATTPRRQRQQERRWQASKEDCMGLGLYWLNEARKRRWTQW